MSKSAFSLWVLKNQLSVEDLKQTTGLNKNTIYNLKNPEGDYYENVKLITYLKLVRAYPETNWKNIFPILSEF